MVKELGLESTNQELMPMLNLIRVCEWSPPHFPFNNLTAKYKGLVAQGDLDLENMASRLFARCCD